MAEEEEVAFDNWEEAEDEPAFDNWEAEAEKVQDPSAQEAAKTDNKPAEVKQQETAADKKDEPLDPRKQFLNKLDRYKKVSDNKFEQYFENTRASSSNQNSQLSTQILKSDKDFAVFAKNIARVINDKCEEEDQDNVDEDSILTFFEESLFLMYNQLEWKSMEGVKSKLKIVKREKKDQEAKALKNKLKEKARKQTARQKGQEKVEEKKPQDDIFGGAGLINSKQVEDELKNKKVEKVEKQEKVEAPKKEEEEEDEEDDFM